MTPDEKLALAMEAVEAADGMVSQAFYQHNDAGDWYCECCHRVVNTTSQISRTEHKHNCSLKRYLELRDQINTVMTGEEASEGTTTKLEKAISEE